MNEIEISSKKLACKFELFAVILRIRRTYFDCCYVLTMVLNALPMIRVMKLQRLL
jgi:hypothetical protein